eukprot:scaffold187603_cov28-Tisochrysis_lutea.AAC.2
MSTAEPYRRSPSNTSGARYLVKVRGSDEAQDSHAHWPHPRRARSLEAIFCFTTMIERRACTELCLEVLRHVAKGQSRKASIRHRGQAGGLSA